MAHQVELKSGETYRGELHEAEDNWNCQLKNITATAKVWFNTVVTLLGQEPGALLFLLLHWWDFGNPPVCAGWQNITPGAYFYQRKQNQVRLHGQITTSVQ